MIIINFHKARGNRHLVRALTVTISDHALLQRRDQRSVIQQDLETAFRAWKFHGINRGTDQSSFRRDYLRERFLLISLTYSYSPLTSFLLRLGENRLALLDRVVQGADIEERLFRQVVNLSVEDPAEAIDCVLDVHHHARHASKLLSHSERL